MALATSGQAVEAAKLAADLPDEPWAAEIRLRVAGELKDDDELAKAPSYAADKEFDWGDRSQETQLHDYYKTRPYWGI